MVIDLQQFKTEYLEVKMLDGKELKLPKPSYGTFLKIIDLETSEKKGIEMLEVLYDTALEIFNSNADGVEYSHADIDRYPVETIRMFMNAYMEFVSNKMQAKNS